jgi:peptidoglycan/LPS O-acetylase OafA/YrhL
LHPRGGNRVDPSLTLAPSWAQMRRGILGELRLTDVVADRGRTPEFDGLRGWAALSVVIYHLCRETFGVLFPVYRSLLPSLLGHGALAYALFFVLSGYVLTVRRWRNRENDGWILALVRRYARLEIPILAASTAYLALMALHLTPSTEAARIVQREDWLGQFTAFDPSLLGAAWFSLVRTYWRINGETYNPFLWTMAVELWGSVIVLSLSQTDRLWREPYSLLILITVLLLHFYPVGACFTTGALIALLQRDGVVFRGEPGRLESALASIALMVAFLAATYFETALSNQLPVSVAAIIVFVGAARSNPARFLLSSPISQWLGRVSFPLYLVQAAIIVSLTSWLIIVLSGAGLLNPWTALGICVVSLAVVLTAAWAFMPVEVFTLWLVRQIGRSRTRLVPVTV